MIESTRPKRTVGTNALTYAHIRNFAALPLDRYMIREYHDYYNVLNWASHRLGLPPRRKLVNSFNDFGLHRVHAWHFFNAISYGKTPWITTFETIVPRWGRQSAGKMESGVRLIAGRSCKGLIALSECNAAMQRRFIQEKYPHYWRDIEPKLKIVHPSQDLLIKSYEEKELSDDRIVFAMVGSLFFRKGGLEVLDA
jgi:hypothetical protein